MGRPKRKNKSNTDEDIQPSSRMPQTRSKTSMPESKKTKLAKGKNIPHSSSDLRSSPNASKSTIKKEDICIMDKGKSDFAEIRSVKAFVDKTLMISKILSYQSSSYLLFVAPRCFGKTTNLTMLHRFFAIPMNEEEKNLNIESFENTLITKDKIAMAHFGQYPVLYLNFKSSGNVRSYAEALEFVCIVVRKAYVDHEYLLKGRTLKSEEKAIFKQWLHPSKYVQLGFDEPSIYSALENLAGFLHRHYKRKIFLIVDEYDGICADAIICMKGRKSETGAVFTTAEQEISNSIGLCQGAISTLLRPDFKNEHVDRAFLTGISYIMSIGLSKLRNLQTFKFQDEYFSEFYGLTIEECKEVLSRPGIQLSSEMPTILDHYNGYQHGILSIWSVLCFLESRIMLKETRMKNYWKERGIVYDLYAALRIEEVTTKITKLLSGLNNVIEIDTIDKVSYRDIYRFKLMLEQPDPDDQNVNIFFTFLLEQGYFSIVETSADGKKIKIKIPNKEVETEFSQELVKFYGDTYNLSIAKVRECASIFDEICNSGDEQNEEKLREICGLINEIIDPKKMNSKNEATLHHIIFITIFHCLKFTCYSEARSSRTDQKKLDLLMLREKIGIIIELKSEKEPVEGLKQIKKNCYRNAFTNPDFKPDKFKVEYYILIGLSMNVDCKISMSVLFNNENVDEKHIVNIG